MLKQIYWMLYAFFWVISRRPKFICRRFRTLCLFHLYRQVGACRMNLDEDMLGYYTGKGLASKPHLFPYNTPTCPQPSSFYTHLPACEDGNRQNVPKRRHINFRRRGITQKKAYNIQDTVKV